MSIAANLIARMTNVMPVASQVMASHRGCGRQRCSWLTSVKAVARRARPWHRTESGRRPQCRPIQERHRCGTRGRSASVAAATATRAPATHRHGDRQDLVLSRAGRWAPDQRHGNGAQSEYHQRHHSDRLSAEFHGWRETLSASCSDQGPATIDETRSSAIHLAGCLPGRRPGQLSRLGISQEYQFSKRATKRRSRELAPQPSDDHRHDDGRQPAVLPGALGDATLSLSVLLRAAGETSAIVGSSR